MRRFLILLCLPLIIVLNVESSALADGWSGDWKTTFGQVRLVQDGPRLYGDYADRGTIEGVVNEAGTEAHAIFLYTDGRWGLVRWKKTGDRLSGFWNWSNEGIPSATSGKSWKGTRTSSVASHLKYARPGRVAVPEGDPQFTENDFASWLNFAEVVSCCAPPPDPGGGNGNWYGSFENNLTKPALNLSIEITHLAGMDTGSASLSIYVPRDSRCLHDMQQAFCNELKRLRGSNGYIQAAVTGQRVAPNGELDQFLIAFRLPGDTRDRLLSVRDDLNYYSLTIWSRDRGIDLSDFAQARPHMCETGTCSQQVPRDVSANPASYRGSLGNTDWAKRLMTARKSGPRQKKETGSDPRNGNVDGGRRLLSDTLGIYDDRGEPLGAVRFAPGPNGISATGEMIGFFGREGPSETTFRLVSQTDQALSFAITIFVGESGERRTGRMMVELPSAARAYPRGTLVLDDEITTIELDPAGPGYAFGGDAGRSTQGEQEPPEDQPGIGIYKYTYRFRDVPLGRSVKLRNGPSRDRAETASVGAETGELQILTCDRDIDNIRFEEASRDVQLTILSAHWCEISTPDGRRGWIPARYLAPETN